MAKISQITNTSFELPQKTYKIIIRVVSSKYPPVPTLNSQRNTRKFAVKHFALCKFES